MLTLLHTLADMFWILISFYFCCCCAKYAVIINMVVQPSPLWRTGWLATAYTLNEFLAILPFGKSNSVANKDILKFQHVCGIMLEHHCDFKAVAVAVSTLIVQLSHHNTLYSETCPRWSLSRPALYTGQLELAHRWVVSDRFHCTNDPGVWLAS